MSSCSTSPSNGNGFGHNDSTASSARASFEAVKSVSGDFADVDHVDEDSTEEEVNEPLETLKLRALWGGVMPKFSEHSDKRSKYTQMVMTTISHIQEEAACRKSGRGSTRKSGTSISSRRKRKRQQGCVISPLSRRWMIWELIGVVLLGYDLVMTPMQVFAIPSNLLLEFVGCTTTVYWSLAMVATFFVGYQVKDEATLEFDLKRIRWNYMRGWFVIDFIIVASDWAGIVIQVIITTNSSSLSYARMARFARFGRLLRTMRLLRVLRVGEWLQQLESMIDSEYISILMLVICNVSCICFLAHIVACFWFYIGDVNEDGSWVTHSKLLEKPFGQQYLLSLGWSLSTLLSSTMTDIVAQTKLEYSLALAILVVGTITISLVFSSTTAAMTRIQQLRSEERDASWKLKSYLKQNSISPTLAARVIRYVEIAKKVHKTRISMANVVLINLLSGPLRIELQMELYAPPLAKHYFFENYHSISMGAMGELCLRAVSTLFLSRGDVLFRCFSDATSMFFLLGGVMVYRRAKGAKQTRNTATVDKGSNFCEPVLWIPWVHHGSMAALMESDVLTMDTDMFCKITESHHDVYLEARLYAARFLEIMNELLKQYSYVWDISFDLMYPEEDNFEEDKTGGPWRNMVKKAEAMSAELMAFDSDTDEEDERNLHAKLMRTSSIMHSESPLFFTMSNAASEWDKQ